MIPPGPGPIFSSFGALLFLWRFSVGSGGSGGGSGGGGNPMSSSSFELILLSNFTLPSQPCPRQSLLIKSFVEHCQL